MTISAINVGRVSHHMQTLSLLNSLQDNVLKLFLEQSRLGSGQRINTPSEDPVGAAKAVKLTQMLDHQKQILANIEHADSFLTMTDNSIQEINDLLIEAHGIASEMVNSTASQSQRDAEAELVLNMIDHMVSLGNRQFQGVYLFAGQEVLSPPFVQETGGVVYRGDLGDLLTTVDESEAASYNVTGQTVFGALSSEVEGWVDLNPALTEDTRLKDVDGAAEVGIDLSYVRVHLDTPDTTFTVDLREADTVGDVIDMMKKAAEDAGLAVGPGLDFDVEINAARSGLDVNAGAGMVTVYEVNQGKTARDLGILGSGTPTINGTDLNPRLTLQTEVADLFGGAGAVLGTFQLSNGAQTEIIDLSSAQTIEEVFNEIKRAGLDIHGMINDDGTGINVRSAVSGFRMTIGENGGNTAETLGIRSLYAGTDLDALNEGRGVIIKDGEDDFRILARDGSTVDVNLDGAETIQDVLDAINAAAGAAGVAINASLATVGNGIQITDSTGGGNRLRIERLNYSEAIDGLGLNKAADPPTSNTMVGDDVNGIKADSVFTALIDLHAALIEGDEQAITRAGERIYDYVDTTNRLQGVVGARSRAMHTRVALTEEAVVASQKLLSEAKDLDYVEAITKFQQAQTTLQANLMTGSHLMRLSLLDYI